MKKIFIIFFCIAIFSCQSQDKNKETIIKFINNIVLNSNYDSSDLEYYLDIDKETLEDKNKKDFFISLMDDNIIDIKQKIDKNELNYIILSNKEAIEKGITSNLIYNDYSKVYYVIVENKIITPIIIKNDKIVSFFYGLTKKENESRPMLLNN
ncbi:hypothetical protein [Ichthyenterobacterium magnum]|nr:hypothetical protein [Ichthyenterobacterium magnum]